MCPNPRLRAANKAYRMISKWDVGQRNDPFSILHGRNVTQLRRGNCLRKGGDVKAQGMSGWSQHIFEAGILDVPCPVGYLPSPPFCTILLQQPAVHRCSPAVAHFTALCVPCFLPSFSAYCLQKPVLSWKSQRHITLWDCPPPTRDQSQWVNTHPSGSVDNR